MKHRPTKRRVGNALLVAGAHRRCTLGSRCTRGARGRAGRALLLELLFAFMAILSLVTGVVFGATTLSLAYRGQGVGLDLLVDLLRLRLRRGGRDVGLRGLGHVASALAGRGHVRFLGVLPGAGQVLLGLPAGGRDELIVSSEDEVNAYDPKTGEQLWRFYIVPSHIPEENDTPALRMAAKTWSGDTLETIGGGLEILTEVVGGLAIAGEFFSRALSPALAYEAETVPAGAQPLLVKVLAAARTTVVFAAAAVSLSIVAGLGLGFLASTAWWTGDPVGGRTARSRRLRRRRRACSSTSATLG